MRLGTEVVGAAMRTAPFRPYPLYVLPMPDAGALAIARALHERGEDVPAVNGALPATQVLAEETARLVGGTATVHEHMRLFDLPVLHAPRPVPGRLRLAALDDHAVCLAWFEAFHRDAAEQAGRPYDEREGEHFTAEDLTARIEQGRVWLWEDEVGEIVHLTSANAPAYGVVRIGPVYTPREHRGRGFASAAVAAVSQLALDDGHRPCLFTDQANPTSNKIYEALGYRPVVDTVNMVVTRPGGS